MKKDEVVPMGLYDHVTIEKTLPNCPSAPGSLTASNSDDGGVRLEWKNAPDFTRAGIKVEAAIKDGPFYEIGNLAADATRFDNTGLQNPADVRYRVRAYNRSGYSAFSNTAHCEK